MSGSRRQRRACVTTPPEHGLELRTHWLLWHAAQLVHCGRYRTACDALSAILPPTEAGTARWHEARKYLLLMLPERFERPWGWWASRKARVIGICLAHSMARDAEQQLREVPRNPDSLTSEKGV